MPSAKAWSEEKLAGNAGANLAIAFQDNRYEQVRISNYGKKSAANAAAN